MLYNITLIYSTLLILMITMVNITNIRTGSQAFLAIIFVPMALYFVKASHKKLIKPWLIKRSVVKSQAAAIITPVQEHIEQGHVMSPTEVNDVNRRLFLKLIGSAGLTTVVFALFKRDAQAAFFGSIPGPGTVALKNTAGEKIDPAEKGPTDGYEIAQVDDNTIPSYYGFLNKNGAWYIAKEGNGGDYRYIRGDDNFSASWSTRTTLVYEQFNNVF